MPAPDTEKNGRRVCGKRKGKTTPAVWGRGCWMRLSSSRKRGLWIGHGGAAVSQEAAVKVSEG